MLPYCEQMAVNYYILNPLYFSQGVTGRDIQCSLHAILHIRNNTENTLFVSDRFPKLPCHVMSPEQLESLPKPLKKCVKTAVSFENNPFDLFDPFLKLFDIPDGSFVILIVSDWFHQVHKKPWHVRNPENIESLP